MMAELQEALGAEGQLEEVAQSEAIHRPCAGGALANANTGPGRVRVPARLASLAYGFSKLVNKRLGSCQCRRRAVIRLVENPRLTPYWTDNAVIDSRVPVSALAVRLGVAKRDKRKQTKARPLATAIATVYSYSLRRVACRSP